MTGAKTKDLAGLGEAQGQTSDEGSGSLNRGKKYKTFQTISDKEHFSCTAFLSGARFFPRGEDAQKCRTFQTNLSSSNL